jgi:hypothetical protein
MNNTKNISPFSFKNSTRFLIPMSRIFTILIVAFMIPENMVAEDSNRDSTRRCQFGVKMGANYSGIFDKESSMFGSEGKFGLAGGLYFRMPLGKSLGIQPEFLFSQKGFRATNQYLGDNFNLNRTVSYFDIPLFFSFHPDKRFTILAGPQYSILLYQRNQYTSTAVNVRQQELLGHVASRGNTICMVAGFDINIRYAVLGARIGYDAFNNRSDGSAKKMEYKNAWIQATLGANVFSWSHRVNTNRSLLVDY